MMKTGKKIVSLLLCIIMLYSYAFAETFSEADAAAYIAALNSKTGDELLEFIDSNKYLSGLSETKAYIEIRENAELFTNSVRDYALDIISSTDMSNMADANRVIEDALLVSALSYCEHWGMLDELIHMFAEEIKTAGGNVHEYLQSSSRHEIVHELMQCRPFLQLEIFADILNNLIAEEKDNTSSGPSSGVGGGNTIGGGGGYVPIPTTQWKVVDDGVLIISGTTMDNYAKTSQIPWYGERLNVREIVIGESITHIGDKAFYGCINVQKITIPEGVTSIGADAFKNCDEMTVYGKNGSYAQIYADQNQIPFIVDAKAWKEKYMTVDFAANTTRWYFDVTVNDYNNAATVFVGIYDADSRLPTVTSESLVADDITSLSVVKNTEAIYAEVFVWDSLMNPITRNLKIEL